MKPGMFILVIILWILGIIGEIRCIVKMVQCDWNAPYKAEILYTAGTFTGAGAIIGWINIPDGPQK